jgi:hypothetical protein
VPLGSYAGFTLEIAFDRVEREYVCTLKNSLHHDVTLGSDAFGNITRIDNALDGLPKKYEQAQEQLANTHQQLENAKAEAVRPFDKEDELVAKTARLAELDALLNMNERGGETIDDGRGDEDEPDFGSVRSRELEIER